MRTLRDYPPRPDVCADPDFPLIQASGEADPVPVPTGRFRRVKGAGAGAVMLIAGVLVSVLGNSSAVGFVLGLLLVGLGAMVLVLTFFYAVGRSEERDRERHPGG